MVKLGHFKSTKDLIFIIFEDSLPKLFNVLQLRLFSVFKPTERPIHTKQTNLP